MCKSLLSIVVVGLKRTGEVAFIVVKVRFKDALLFELLLFTLWTLLPMGVSDQQSVDSNPQP